MAERPRPRFARRLPTKRFGLGLVATTLLHELGHAVGIGRSADDGSVMYPKLIDKASVTTPATGCGSRVTAQLACGGG